MKSDFPYLGHISEAIAAIELYVSGGREIIENDLPSLKADVARLAGDLGKR